MHNALVHCQQGDKTWKQLHPQLMCNPRVIDINLHQPEKDAAAFSFFWGGWGFKGSGFNFVWRKNDLCPISWICSPPNCVLWSPFSAYVQRLNFCAYICKRRMPGINQVCTHDPQKPKFAGNLWNTLDVSTEFPASASVDSLFTVSRSMKLGPSLYTLMWVFILFFIYIFFWGG